MRVGQRAASNSCFVLSAVVACIVVAAEPVPDLGFVAGDAKPDGNVAEWVVDELFSGGYAKPAAQPQPVPADKAIQWPVRLFPRVLRGGPHYDEASECRSACRKGSNDADGTRENPDWKESDPQLPKSPWWYTEEPNLGVGMRVMRPFVVPATMAERRRSWEADEQSVKDHVQQRLEVGNAKRAIVDSELPAILKKEGNLE